MASPVVGTPAVTTITAEGATATINMPGSLVSGRGLISICMLSEAGGGLTGTGWNVGPVFSAANAQEVTIQIMWKISDGLEGATEVFDMDGPNSQTWAVTFMVDQALVDMTDPFNTNNFEGGFIASANPFALAANTITGLAATSQLIFIQGDQANRTMTALDADLTVYTLTLSLNGSGYCMFVAFEDAPGAGNAAYSNTMSDERDFAWMLLELKAAAAAATAVPVMMAQYRQRRN